VTAEPRDPSTGPPVREPAHGEYARAVRRRSIDARVAGWTAAVVLLTSLLVQPGDLAWSDGMSMYQVARSLVEDGDVAIELGVVWEGADGRYYSPFGIGLSLVAAPAFAVVRLVRAVGPVPEFAAQGLVSLLAPVILAGLAAAVFALGRRLGAAVRTAAVVGVGSALGTFVALYGKAFSSEPLAALLTTVAIERILAGSAVLAGTAAAGAALTRPQLFLFAPVVLWALWRRGGTSAALRGSLPIAVAGAVQLAYNVVRWGDLANFGYSDTPVPQGFTTPILEGLGGLLFHPEKSILLFAPVVVLVPFGLLHLWRRGERVAVWSILGAVVIAFALSATWWDWDGGFTWGPRLLIPGVVPAIAVVAPWADRTRSRRVLVVAAFAAGAIVTFPSLFVGGGAQLEDRPPPEHGPRILRQYELLPGTIAYTFDHLYEAPEGRDAARTLDLWQTGLAWRTGRLGLAAAIAASTALAVGAVLATRRLIRAASGDGAGAHASVAGTG
jgi:hypothetical protein